MFNVFFKYLTKRKSFQFPRKTYKLEKQEQINYRTGNYSTVSCLQNRKTLNILKGTKLIAYDQGIPRLI